MVPGHGLNRDFLATALASAPRTGPLAGPGCLGHQRLLCRKRHALLPRRLCEVFCFACDVLPHPTPPPSPSSAPRDQAIPSPLSSQSTLGGGGGCFSDRSDELRYLVTGPPVPAPSPSGSRPAHLTRHRRRLSSAILLHCFPRARRDSHSARHIVGLQLICVS